MNNSLNLNLSIIDICQELGLLPEFLVALSDDAAVSQTGFPAAR
jgi:hypothetical protein